MVKVVKALTTLALALAILIAGSTRDVHADMDEAKKLFRKGEKAFSAGKYRKALERYQEAYAEESLAGFHFNIAQCHRNLGEYKKAAAAFAAYLDESDDPPNKTQVEGTLEQLRILAKARRDVRRRDYEGARKHYERALRIEPIAPVHRDLARTFERLGLYDDALTAYRDYLEQQPEAEDREDIDEAIERLEKELSGGSVTTPETGATEKSRPIYKKWWFWAGIVGVAAAGTAAAIVLSDSLPNSDLGNIGFER